MDALSQSDSELLLAPEGSLPEGVKGYRRDGRRIYERSFRERVAAECRDSGRSLSSIALHYGINANLVRRWMDQYTGEKQTILPVSLSTLPAVREVSQSPTSGSATDAMSATSLRIEVGGVSVSLEGRIEPAIVQAVVHALTAR